MKFAIRIKRIYETPNVEDGYRVLVDKLWPRGIKKSDAQLDEWNKTITPSTELRKWFNHDAAKFEEFKKLYKAELQLQKKELARLKFIATAKNVTLVYAAKNTRINHAIILQEVIEKMK
ncbi:MAG: DUF488 domain-containing protein [Chitinophagales bacterium]